MIIKANRLIAIIFVFVIAASALLISADNNIEEQNKIKLPIVMYHHISEKRSALGAYVISPTQFENDLIHFEKCGYTTITVAQLADFAEGKFQMPEKPIMITFDDGYLSFYEYAYPLLKKYKMHAVLSVIGKYSDLYSNCDDRNVNYAHVTWDIVTEMAKSGYVEIENHTYDMHTIGDRKGCVKKSGESEECYRLALSGDIKTVQEKIKTATGTAPIAFTYPFGRMCKQADDIINEMGFKISFGCEEKVNYLDKYEPNLHRLRRFNRAHGKSSQEFFKNIL